MKKVLTLVSALSMVAGSAMAGDHNWNMSEMNQEDFLNGVSSKWGLTVKGQLSVKDGTLITSGSNINDASNVLEFEGTLGDNMFISISHLDGKAGKVYYKQNGIVKEAEVVAGDSEVKCVLSADGTVQLCTDKNIGIKEIRVVSKAYYDAIAVATGAKGVVTDATRSLAKYVTDYSVLYTAAKGDVNQLSAKVDDIYNSIVKNQAENKGENIGESVDDGVTPAESAVWIKELNELTKSINEVLVAADKAVADYASLDLKTAKDYYTSQQNSGVYKDKDKKIYLRSWIDPSKDEWKTNIDAYYTQTCQNALDEMKDYKNYNSKISELQAAINETQTRVDNLIARAKKEDAISTKVSTLVSNVKNIKVKVADEAVNAYFASEHLAAVAELVQSVNDFYKDFDFTYDASDKGRGYQKRYEYTAQQGVEWDEALNANQAGCQQNLVALRKMLFEDVKSTIETKVKEVQTRCDEVAYNISAKFDNQKDEQEKFQTIFAGYQNDITKIVETLAKQGTEAEIAKISALSDFKKTMASLEQTSKNIEETRKSVMGSENQKLYDVNAEKWAVFETLVQQAKDLYTEGIERIEKYLEVEEIAKNAEASGAVKQAEVDLFNSYKQITAVRDEAKEKYDACQESVDAFTVTEFDYSPYADKLTKIQEEDIVSYITTAKKAVNGVAKNYLETNYWTEGTIAWAKRFINGKKPQNPTNAGEKEADIALYQLEDLIAEADTKVAVAEPIYGIADLIPEIKEDMLAVVAKVNVVVKQLELYNEIDAEFIDLKATWTVVSSKKVDGKELAETPEMVNINNDITELHKALDDKAGDIQEADKADFDAKIKTLRNRINDVDDPVNKANLSDVELQINAIKVELEDAKVVVNGYSEGVKNVYLAILEGIDGELNTVKANAQALYEAKNLKGDALSAINAELQKKQQAVKDCLEDAKVAEDASKKVPGDYNDDKVVNAVDAAIVIERLGKKLTVKDYNNFLNDYKTFVNANK